MGTSSRRGDQFLVQQFLIQKHPTRQRDGKIFSCILDYTIGRVIGGMLGKGFITVSFDGIHIWSCEIFPTVVR